ncbi:glycosyltransferase family 31 protein [Hortaea werneckii]|nr:glycosyltransferase family 31 protein [Hortaea werneckii]
MLSSQRIVLLVTGLLCLALFVKLWRDPPAVPSYLESTPLGSHGHSSDHTPVEESKTKHDPSAGADADACAGLERLKDVVFVLKTGATEIYEKLPIHLATTFACGSDYVIYSDLEQQFGVVPIQDALASVSPDVQDQDEDLAQYRLLKEHVAGGGDAAELKGEKSWGLDKWKFLPMVTDAYKKFGETKKWYFFMEADTYVSLQNLLLFLNTLDERKSVFAGAQVMIGDTEFAHGGSGVVLSAPAAKAFNASYLKDQPSWEKMVAGECCGDKMMAEVLLKADPSIKLHTSFPLIQGETPASLDWSEKHWCMPAVTWHHVDAVGIDKLWQFDREWREAHGAGEPMLFEDYHKTFVLPQIRAADGKMKGWDNLAQDWSFRNGDDDNPASNSAKACERFCRGEEHCLQWFWSPGFCKAGKVVRLGWAMKKRPGLGSADDRIAHFGEEESKKAVSGWFLDRIEAWQTAQGVCDRSPWRVSGN